MTVAPPLVVPHDAAARARILSDLDDTLFVEAGAGSGKTTSLVGRFVALVLAGADVASITAITFTEAAAAELRARIRETLEDLAAGRPVRGIDADDRAATRAATALERLDRAAISTLHAFAQRLLAGAPVEAGLPPRVDVHDEISSALRTEERWHRFVDRLLDAPELEVALRAGLALQVDVQHLAAVAAAMDQNWDLLVGVDLDADRSLVVDEVAVAVSVDVLLEAADDIAARAGECTDETDNLYRWVVADMERSLAPLRAAASDPYTLLHAAANDLPKRCATGRAANWPGGGKTEIFDRWDRAVADIRAQLERITDLVLRRLSAEVAAHVLAEAEARRRDGRLEFHDLLVLARQLLRIDVDVRRRLHDRYRYLLIDEFQDTDPIQVELAVRIAADPDHDTSLSWDEVDVEPGRLFFVGDPKQSIYRFRRADIDLFLRTAARHPSGATRLDTNFRTVQPIVEFCNQLFGHLIEYTRAGEGDDDPIAQPAYADLQPWREPLAGDPGPAVVLVGGADASSTAESLRRAEAADIASTLARAHRDGWLVHPDGATGSRPCRWGDMAVLLPSRTSLPHLRAALEDAGVPYRLETGSLVYATTEVRDLLSVCRAIDDPGDEIALVGALRSPAYGCGDDDLLRWRRAGRSWSYLEVDDADEPDPVDHGPVAAALRDLAERHRSRPFRSVPAIVESVVRDRALMEISLDGGRHRDSWRLYRVVVEHARQFADTDPGGLRAFLRWAELQTDDKLRATVPVLPEADVDAVRIMTVHGAKGLEFGITAVSGLSGRFPYATRGAVVRFRPEGGYDVRMKRGLETAQFEARRTVEDVMDAHEGIRLLYVALTRARDHLVVSLHHKPAAQVCSHAQRIATVVDGGLLLDPAAVERLDGSPGGGSEGSERPDRPQVPVPTVGAAVTDAEAARWQEDQMRWAERRARLTARGASGGTVTATAVAARLVGGQEPTASDDSTSRAATGRRGRAGTAVGAAVHAVLQHADITDPAATDVGALAEWQALAEGVPGAAAEVERNARAALASPLVRRAVAARRWWREIHVGVPLASVTGALPTGEVDLLEGFVDLLFETDDGLVVVDHKTDTVPDERAIDEVLARYTPQGAAYAVAVEAVTGRPVTEVHFLLLRGDDAVDVPVPDLAAAMDRVRAALATW